MVMIKHFVEFHDHIFPIEDIQYVERYYSSIPEKETKKWNSLVVFNTYDHYFKFPEEKYNELKDLIFNFKNKNKN